MGLKHKEQRGEMVVEASIVVTMVLILIVAMFYLGLMLYQHTLMTAVANQAATAAAQTYSNEEKDLFTGYIDENSVYHSVELDGTRSAEYLANIQQKAKVAALYKLKSLRVLSTGSPDITVSVVSKSGEPMKSQVVVDISDSYTLPFAVFFGNAGVLNFTVQGRADCYDLLEYMNGAAAISKGYEGGGNALPLTNAKCTVRFYRSQGDTRPVKVVTVLQMYSISGSAARTNCRMPADPRLEDAQFGGWKDERGNDFTADTIVRGDMNVYAQWSVTVTLDAQGGYVTPGSVRAKQGEAVSLPTPTKQGKYFLGWYTQPDGGGSQFESGQTPVPKSMTLYACWCSHRDPATGASWMAFAERHQYECNEVGGRAESYELYRCTKCGEEQRHTIPNKHYIGTYWNYGEEIGGTQNVDAGSGSSDSFNAVCDVDHLRNHKSYTGRIYLGNGKWGDRTVQVAYHCVCEGCGMIQPKAWLQNKDRQTYRYDYIMNTAYKNVEGKPVKPCQDPGYIREPQ